MLVSTKNKRECSCYWVKRKELFFVIVANFHIVDFFLIYDFFLQVDNFSCKFLYFQFLLFSLNFSIISMLIFCSRNGRFFVTFSYLELDMKKTLYCFFFSSKFRTYTILYIVSVFKIVYVFREYIGYICYKKKCLLI